MFEVKPLLALPSYGIPDASLKIEIQGRMNRKAWARKLRDCLTPEHRTYAEAGTNTGRHWSPFQATKRDLIKYVEKHPGCTMKDAIDGITHHYSSDSNARSTLGKWIGDGVISEIKPEQDGRSFRMYVKGSK